MKKIIGRLWKTWRGVKPRMLLFTQRFHKRCCVKKVQDCCGCDLMWKSICLSLRRYSGADCHRGLRTACSDDLRGFEGLHGASVWNIWPTHKKGTIPAAYLFICLTLNAGVFAAESWISPPCSTAATFDLGAKQREWVHVSSLNRPGKVPLRGTSVESRTVRRPKTQK